MQRESIVIDSSGKWAPAEAILEIVTSEGDAGPSPKEDAQLALQNGPAHPVSSNQREGSPSTTVGPVPPPPPPPGLGSQGNIVPSDPQPYILARPNTVRNTQFVPVRRASPVPNPGRQSQVSNSFEPNTRNSTNASSAFTSYPYQQSRFSPASTPYVVQPPNQPSYSSTPTASLNAYQNMRPPTTPQMFSSPAPMSQYGSPRPGTYLGSPVSYPGGQQQSSRANSYPVPQQVGTSPAYLPNGQSATQSFRPPTTNSMQTPQSVYGGTSQSYRRPQTSPAIVQPFSGSSQQPFTPGNLPYSNTTQMSGTMPATIVAPKTQNAKKIDAFVANDPFRPQSYGKHQKEKDDMTFDDIPMPDPPSTSMSNPSSSGPMPMMGDPYSFPQSQQPVYGGSQSLPHSAPPASGTYTTPVGYSWPPSNQASVGMGRHESTSASRPSQGGDYSVPVSQMPNGSDRPQGPQQPQEQPRPMTPMQSGQQPPYLPGPVRRPSTNESVPNPPMAEPLPEGTPNQPRPTYGTQSPPPSPPPGQQSSYPPVYDPDAMSWYDPYDQTRLDTPVYPPPTSFPPAEPYPYPYYPSPDFPRPSHVYPMRSKASLLSRIGDFFSWPFSRSSRFDAYQPPTQAWDESSNESKATFSTVAVTFLVATLPSQLYLHFLLRLPSLYFSRVARIFEEADLTLPEIKKMALETASQDKGKIDLHMFESSNVPPQYERLKVTWESFIDSVMREWKTFNIISVLLLSAILTILQIQGAADDPITRSTALFSLICALMSLLYGCMYIIRFGSMRKTYKAAEWALEAKRTKTGIWWNVWVLLAMPAIWLTWSLVLYIACIMSFVWRSSPQDNGPPLLMSKGALLTVRIVITTVLGLGIVYAWLILNTFSRYGEAMDKAWKKRIDGWIEEKAQMPPAAYPYTPYFDPYQPSSYQPYGESQFPGYIDLRQAAPSYTDLSYGYSSDPKTGFTDPGFGPTYASANYVPPPEPYDSPTPSRAGSPQSTSSTLNVTRSNTQHNKMSGLQREDSDASAIYNGPGYPVRNPLPVPPKIPTSPSDIPPRIVPKKALAVPPPPSLPPIPGTPATAFFDNNSARNSHSSSGAGYSYGLGLNFGDRDDDSQENRVRFRSPLVSAQGSSLGENDADAESAPRLSPDASGLSMRRGSPPDSVGPGQDSDSLRRRR
ncbi:hypothetical protein GALMADRAFT_254612 [Galerina marginata CBS 339.88]|uniref:Uncharacterized protein n=1 Tax=Galerina marginata (strain CBS 339.88) TaxID=685588 RepID=A0A067SJ83_GALM3|nr:hypothetical protein GALMADRAFT_254612 [Galerina marginata CBS 339.88]